MISQTCMTVLKDRSTSVSITINAIGHISLAFITFILYSKFSKMTIRKDVKSLALGL